MSSWPLSRLIAVSFAAILAAATPWTAARAQAAAPAPAAGTLINIPQVTPGHLAAARDLVIASGLARSFTPVVPTLMNQINLTVTNTRPELGPDLKVVLKQLEPEFLKLPDEMTDTAARFYTAVMSEQECKDALAFFKSAAGQKFAGVQPTIMANLTAAVEPWSKQLAARMYERVRDEMKKKGHEL